MSRITVWTTRAPTGWEHSSPPQDKDGNKPPRFPVVDVGTALATRYPTDAHFVPYRIPGVDVCCRVNGGGLAELNAREIDLVYDAIPIDCDAPKDELCRHPVEGEADRKRWPARRDWVARELAKLAATPLWATVGWYQTRGGFRLLWLLPVGTKRAAYLALLWRLYNHLESIGLVPDWFKDFGRCYRLPYVVRDGVTADHAVGLSRLGQLPEIPDFFGAAPDKAAPLAQEFAAADGARLGPFELPEVIPDGDGSDGRTGRGKTLSSYGAQLRHKGYDGGMILSALMLANAARCKPPMPHDRLERIAKSVTRYDPDPDATKRSELDDVVIRKGGIPELAKIAETLLAGDGVGVYQRSGELVCVQRDPEPDLGMAPGAAHIRRIGNHALGGVLGELARWVRPKRVGDDWEFYPEDVPDKVVNVLVDKRSWPELLPLTGVVETPTLRPDGSVLDVTGYDNSTGLVFSAARGFLWPLIDETPTHAAALAGITALREIVVDFPFATAAHESVALAAMLTVVGRPAVVGATPLFLFDATTPGSGKSLLAHAVSTLGSGHTAGVMIQTDAVEMEKRVTALLLAGERTILIDNVDRPLGGASVDGAITADIWQGRRLGASEMLRVANRATWIATGNNITLKGDLARRCLRVYMVPEQEQPEARDGFKHPDLLEWIRTERGRLVAAALTVLRAYVAAGKPTVRMVPFGGFGPWSRLIRSALVWCGMADPCATRAEIKEIADGALEAVRGLLVAWSAVFVKRPTSVRAVMDVVAAQAFGGTGGAQSDDIAAMRACLVELCGDNKGELNAKRAGWVLRRFAGRIVGGKRFERCRDTKAGALWRVVDVGDVISAIPADNAESGQ